MFEGNVLVGFTEAKPLRATYIDFSIPVPSNDIKPDSVEWREFWDVSGPHIQLFNHLKKLGKDPTCECDEGDWSCGSIEVMSVDDVVTAEALTNILAANDFGLLNILVQSEIEIMKKQEIDRAVWEAMTPEERVERCGSCTKDRAIEIWDTAFARTGLTHETTTEEKRASEEEVDAMLATIRIRKQELNHIGGLRPSHYQTIPRSNKMIEENITGSIPEAKQPTLAEVIPYLELWQQNTSEDVATFREQIESPWSCHDNEVAQSHFKMLLAEAQHEVDCLSVVIAKLKWELGFEECEVFYPEAKKKGYTTEEMDVEADAMLIAIRRRAAEVRQQQQQPA